MVMEIEWRAAGDVVSLGGAVEAVAEQAKAQPHSLAVMSPSESITFGELETASNRLARELVARGVELETPVGLYMERAPAFVVGALAILKTGGTYVPLDPDAPRQRTASILRDCKAPLLLSHRWKATRLPPGPWDVLDMDADHDIIQSRRADPLAFTHCADSLAYITYAPHRAGELHSSPATHGDLARLMQWHRKRYSVTRCDYASQIAGLGFDAAVREIWCNLGAGALVHMIGDFSHLASEPLRDWLVREEITIAFVPAPMAERLRALDWPAHTALRALVSVADAGLGFHSNC